MIFICRWAMGSPERTVLFIRNCLVFENKLDVRIKSKPLNELN